MERFLKRFGISSTIAISGEDALSFYDKDKIDFVFLDIRMKGIDGIGVLKELKQRNPDVKVVMITGSSDKTSRETALQLGALDYISKPLDLSELKEKIEKYVLVR
jgi:two-component system response regulator (stage 0 sporulation protein F)